MNLEQILSLFKSLADSSRLCILQKLLENPCYTEELAEMLNLAPSTVSFHLSKLEKAGLVVGIKQQYYTQYQVNKDFFDVSLSGLLSFENPESQLQDERIRKYKEKVLRTFMPEGVINKLPAQNKKKWIVLEHISKVFEPERTYSEKEVNELIKPGCPDYCTVRRLLVSEGIMQRENGIYRMSTPAEQEQYTNYRNLQGSWKESLAAQSPQSRIKS